MDIYGNKLVNTIETKSFCASNIELGRYIHHDVIMNPIDCGDQRLWLVVLRINVDLAIFQPYLDLESEDNQSLKIQVARPGIEPGPLAPQAKNLTTRPPLLPWRLEAKRHGHNGHIWK